jgi:[CysO sulfur-carrier protein]-S-L-cysteine hydrolase
MRAGRKEIGGVLMGEQIAQDHFQLVDFSVDDSAGSVAHFVRSPEYHAKVLNEFFERTGKDYARYNYLGEWHSHPSFRALPSTEDINSMLALVEGERSIDFSVLLIVKCAAWWRLECSVTLFMRGFDPCGVDVRYVV